jgi:pyridoxamine 5'-phosphate oxidase
MTSEINKKLQDLRVNYKNSSLEISDCEKSPINQFKKWLNDAITSQCDEPNAFTLSTVAGDQPRSRVVLLKGIEEDNFLFYTNFESDKGRELDHNKKVAMNFLWLPLERQVRIEGRVLRAPSEISDAYFESRPLGSQISAIASPQSRVLGSREELEKRVSEIEAKKSELLKRPENWGGYLIKPSYFEFWQGRANRLHDRIRFELTPEGWRAQRLAP